MSYSSEISNMMNKYDNYLNKYMSPTLTQKDEGKKTSTFKQIGKNIGKIVEVQANRLFSKGERVNNSHVIKELKNDLSKIEHYAKSNTKSDYDKNPQIGANKKDFKNILIKMEEVVEKLKQSGANKNETAELSSKITELNDEIS